MPITLRVFSENQYSCGFLRIVQLRWWTHFEFEVWSHQNPVKLTRKIYLRKNCEPQGKKDEESWKSSADPNNPRDPTVFLRTSRLLLFLSTLFHSSSSLFCSKSVNKTSDFMVIMTMIRQWNGLGGKCDFSPVMKPNCCRFLGSNPGSGGVRRRRRWGNRLSGQERWSWGSEKKREGLASKVGVKKTAVSGEKSLLLSRRTSFFQENRFSILKFLPPSSFSDANRRCKINTLQHNRKYHFPSSTFAFWEMLGSTKQASKDGGVSTLKSTEGPCAVCMSINVPHDRQDRHDRRQTSYSYSLFASWRPSPSVLTASKSCTNISATSVNFICTEDAQWGTYEDRNHNEPATTFDRHQLRS